MQRLVSADGEGGCKDPTTMNEWTIFGERGFELIGRRGLEDRWCI